MTDICDTCVNGKSMCPALEDVLSAGRGQDVCVIKDGEVISCKWHSERLEGSGGGN